MFWILLINFCKELNSYPISEYKKYIEVYDELDNTPNSNMDPFILMKKLMILDWLKFNIKNDSSNQEVQDFLKSKNMHYGNVLKLEEDISNKFRQKAENFKNNMWILEENNVSSINMLNVTAVTFLLLFTASEISIKTLLKLFYLASIFSLPLFIYRITNK